MFMKPLRIKIREGKEIFEILINENLVCSVHKNNDGSALIKMANGEEYECLSPAYDEWDNDTLIS